MDARVLLRKIAEVGETDTLNTLCNRLPVELTMESGDVGRISNSMLELGGGGLADLIPERVSAVRVLPLAEVKVDTPVADPVVDPIPEKLGLK